MKFLSGQSWLTTRVADLVLAGALAAWGGVEAFVGEANRWLELALMFGALGMTLPLAWRRTRALAMVSVVAGAISVQSLLTNPPEGIWTLIAVIIAAYSVAAFESSITRSALVAGVLGLAVVVSILRDQSDSSTNIAPTVLVFVLVPWIAGRTLHHQDRRTHTLAAQVGSLERERSLLAREAVVQERARIARELHDVVAHSLSVIAIQADAAESALEHDASLAREPLVAVKQTAREALREMRLLVGFLRDAGDSLGLEPQPGLQSVNALLDQVRSAGLAVDLTIEGDVGQVAPGVDLVAYRIIQESLTNALRHAKAKRADVAVRYLPDAILVQVSDDGVGIPPRQSGAQVGHGLVGMRERVSLYGGSLDITATVGRGVCIEARLPR